MQIELETDKSWNEGRITLVELTSGLGDQIQICIHKENDNARMGTTVKVSKDALLRAAVMLSVEYSDE